MRTDINIQDKKCEKKFGFESLSESRPRQRGRWSDTGWYDCSKRVQRLLGKLGHQLSRVSCVERAALPSMWIEVSNDERRPSCGSVEHRLKLAKCGATVVQSGRGLSYNKGLVALCRTCADVFAPLIVRLVTLSFSEDKFAVEYKDAVVTPLLKKEGLDADCLGNYRPISNLHTISKIVEGIYMSRLAAHQTTAVSSQPTGVVTAPKLHFSECWMTYTAPPAKTIVLHYCSSTYLRRSTLWTRALFCGDFDSLMVCLAQHLLG